MPSFTYGELADLCFKLSEAFKYLESQSSTKEDIEDSVSTVVAAPDPLPEVVEEVKPARNESEEVKAKFTREYLDAMPYTKLKSLAASLGISGAGKKETIVNAILNTNVNNEEASVNEEVKGDVEQETLQEEMKVDEVLYDKIITRSDDELKDMLKSIDWSAIGKHQTLVDKVIRAINMGALANPLEEVQEEPEAVEQSENEAVEDIDIPEPFAKFTQFEVNYSKMTEARAEKLAAIREEEKDKKYNEAEMDDMFIGYLDGYSAPDYTRQEKMSIYAEIRCLYVDDAGQEHDDQDVYNINGKLYCCGSRIRYNAYTKVYTCAVCKSQITV
ncbi:MAG: hypothetical protein LBS84_05210 [Clostridiales bacterium]|nr:hypothetical protein [Clostridiales bacterium]